MTHICVGKLTIIGSDNDWSGRHQAIIWTNAGILLIGPFNRNWNIFIQENAFDYVVWKMSAIFSLPQCVNGKVIYICPVPEQCQGFPNISKLHSLRYYLCLSRAHKMASHTSSSISQTSDPFQWGIFTDDLNFTWVVTFYYHYIYSLEASKTFQMTELKGKGQLFWENSHVKICVGWKLSNITSDWLTAQLSANQKLC